MKATWSRLQSGGWGVRVQTDEPFEEIPEPGTTVTVEKKDKSTTEVKLGRRLWDGAAEGGGAVGLYSLD
jgi:hypothetical protein